MIKLIKNKKVSELFIYQWVISLVIILLSRLPYLLGKHCYFDGDEAIIGIMAQDLLHGRNVPLYFYGQQYGFSFFEVVGVTLGIILFGNTVWALKFGALLVFSLGTTFLFRLFIKRGVHFWWTVFAISLIVMFPGWIIWAAKARGGYVTAYAIACIIFYIIQTQNSNLKWMLMMGVLLAIGVQSQIFIVGSVSILCLFWVLTGPKKIQKTLVLVGSFMASYMVLRIFAMMNSSYWTLSFSGDTHFQHLIPFLTQFPKIALSYFYYELVVEPRIESIWFGGGYYLIMLVLLIWVLWKGEGNIRYQLIWLMLGGGITVLLIMLMPIITYRYYLGLLTSIQLMAVLVIIKVWQHRTWRWIGLMAWLPLAIGFSNTSAHIPDSWLLPERNDNRLYNEMLAVLHTREIKHVFATDPLLQWQLCYSGVPARFTSKSERINRFLNEVNHCYADPNCKTAVVGYNGYFGFIDGFDDFYDHVILVNDKYFIYEGPESRHLEKGHFELDK